VIKKKEKSSVQIGENFGLLSLGPQNVSFSVVAESEYVMK
jgi:hypothetical protein